MRFAGVGPRAFLLLVLLGCLGPAPVRASMGYLGMRWNQDSHPFVAVGHEELRNRDKAQVVSMIQSAFADWTNRLEAGSLSFMFFDDGDRTYWPEDPGSAVWWGQPPAGACLLASSELMITPQTLNRRTDRFQIRLSTRLDAGNACADPDWTGDYCWYACEDHPASACDADHTYDARSCLLHEAGHAAIGLGHYTPCDWAASVMFPAAEANCTRHGQLGYTDISTTAWTLRNIHSDPSEPSNDYLTGAVTLGTGQLWNPPINQLAEAGHLPGHADLDAWVFQVNGMPMNEGYFVTFIVWADDPTLRLRMAIYQNMERIQDLSASRPNEDLWWDTLAENAEYRVFVTTTDGIGGGTTNRYVVGAQLYRPATSTPEDHPDPEDLRVIQSLQLVRGRGSGVLSLYDVGGRSILSVPVEGNDWTVSLRDRGLGSGAYFLRLVTPSGCSRARVVILR